MAQNAKITVHPSYEIGEISERLFSAFLEPIGTIVNGTMFNPKHPTADEQGFRTDFIDALKAAGLPAVRMPGGNFVSAWQWKDSIGPKADRKVHLDPSWHQYITTEVGHDEYLQWAEKVGTEALYTVNMGTGTIQDAMDLVEYTNHTGGSYWSDLRRKNGTKPSEGSRGQTLTERIAQLEHELAYTRQEVEFLKKIHTADLEARKEWESKQRRK